MTQQLSQARRAPARYPVTAKRWEQDLPVTLVVEIPDAKDAGHRVEVRKSQVLPFLPRRHDELAVGRDGDYLTVDMVFWSPEEGLTVWFAELQHDWLLPHYLADGWKIQP